MKWHLHVLWAQYLLLSGVCLEQPLAWRDKGVRPGWPDDYKKDLCFCIIVTKRSGVTPLCLSRWNEFTLSQVVATNPSNCSTQTLSGHVKGLIIPLISRVGQLNLKHHLIGVISRGIIKNITWIPDISLMFPPKTLLIVPLKLWVVTLKV